MQFTEARIKLEGVWACGIWVRQQAVMVAGSVKSVIWVAFNIDKAAYIGRLEAAQQREEEKSLVLTKVLKAKRALQDKRDANSKLSESIKKVSRRN